MENNFDIKKFLIENKLTRLSEQDNEWDLEAGPEWNTIELTVGDTFTPEMFNKAALSHYKWVDGGIIKKYKTGNDHVGLHDWIQISYINDKGKRKYDWNLVYTLNNWALKPEYRIIPPLNEQQDDDDWDLEAGEEWNVTELGIGDYITLDMLNQDNQIHLKYFFQVFKPNTFPLLIDRRTKSDLGDSVILKAINFKGDIQRGYSWMVKTLNNIVLKPGYQIVIP